jgi:hypothetical protein
MGTNLVEQQRDRRRSLNDSCGLKKNVKEFIKLKRKSVFFANEETSSKGIETDAPHIVI